MDKYTELFAFLYSSAKPLIGEFEDLMLILNREAFPAALERFVEKLCRLADHAAHEIEDLKPAPPRTEEFSVTEELCEEAFRAGLAAKDFSVVFFAEAFQARLQCGLPAAGRFARRAQDRAGLSRGRRRLQGVSRPLRTFQSARR